MADERQTVGEALGLAARSIKRRLINAFLAARPNPNAKLTPTEAVTVALKMWQGIAAGLVPTSPDGSIIIGTQNDANGDPQLTLRAINSSVTLTGVAPFALYQFWRGETYGPKDASGNKFDLAAHSGGATYADLLSYGQGAKFAGGYLQNSDTSGKFQDLGDMSAFLSFQLDAFPAEGASSLLFAIDGEGAGDYNCLLNAYLEHTGAIGTGHEVGGTWYGYSPAGTVLELGRMYTLSVVRTSTGVSVYLDGVLLGTGTMPAAGGGALSTMLVGGVPWGDGTRLSGSIASLALFHGALSSDDIKLLHRNEVFRWGSRPGGGGAPTAHASSHQPGGSDAMAVDAAAATGSLRTIGTGALQACAGNDSRLSNSRAPTSHASTHAAGQSDALSVTEGMLSLADNTTADASSTKHGLLPKLPNDTNKILHGDGVWAALAEAGLNLTDLTTGDVSTTRHGFVPKAPNDATRYLDGSGAWSVPAANPIIDFCEYYTVLGRSLAGFSGATFRRWYSPADRASDFVGDYFTGSGYRTLVSPGPTGFLAGGVEVGSGASASSVGEVWMPAYHPAERSTIRWYVAIRIKAIGNGDSHYGLLGCRDNVSGYPMWLGSFGANANFTLVDYAGSSNIGSLDTGVAVDTAYHVLEMWSTGAGVLGCRCDGNTARTKTMSTGGVSAGTCFCLYAGSDPANGNVRVLVTDCLVLTPVDT